MATHKNVKFVWFQFTTYMGTSLVRMLPVSKFIELLKNDGKLSITNALLHLSPYDHVAKGGSLTGSFYLKPDISSLHIHPGSDQTRAVVIPWWVNEHGVPIEECARFKLQSLVDQIQLQSGFSILVGFEVEVIFMRHTTTPKSEKVSYEAFTTDHSWSSMTPNDELLLGLLEEIVMALNDVGIEIEQFHGEMAPSQWEFVLPPGNPMIAVDHLVIARKTIMSIARKHGLHATLHPRPFPSEAGTGSHVHISLNSDDRELHKTEPFFAGILAQFPAIAAFTMPHEISYSRVAAGISSGGLYCAWGWDNRETPLRRIGVNHFEIKMMDGLANPYLALCAMFAAGLDGLMAKSPLVGGDCPKPPSELSKQELAALGIHTLLPTSLEASLDALENNSILSKYLGVSMVSIYLAIKKEELNNFKKMTSAQVDNWIMSKF